MKILILDDDDKRHEIFDLMLKGHQVTHARRYRDFFVSMSKERPDLVYLDHDLDLAARDPSVYRTQNGSLKAFTGLDAARLLAALPKKNRPNFVVVHSMNSSRSQDIVKVLARAKIPYSKIPFVEIYASFESEESSL